MPAPAPSSLEPARIGWRGYAASAAVVAVMASFVLASRAGLTQAFGPIELLSVRFAVAGLVFLPWFLRRRAPPRPPALTLAGLAACGGAGFALAAYAGFRLAPAAHGSALIHGVLPLWTIVLGACLFGQRPRRLQLAGCAAIAGGIVALLADSLASSPSALAGDGLLLCASALWALYGLLARRSGLRALDAAAWIAGVSALAVLPLQLALGEPARLAAAPWRDLLLQASVQGLAVGVASVVLYGKALELAGPAVVASMAACVPAVVAVAAVPLLHEELDLPRLAGVLLVVAGAFASALAGSRGRTVRGAGATHSGAAQPARAEVMPPACAGRYRRRPSSQPEERTP